MVKVTSDLVIDRNKLSLVFVALLSLCISMRAGDIANFTLWVIRRSTEDFYQLNSESMVHINCDPKHSYLVNEKQCVLDQDLFYGMTFNYNFRW